MSVIHKNLAAGRWLKLTLAEQMGNIGSEVHRMIKAQEKDQAGYNQAFARALDLMDLTIRDSRWSKGHRELTRVREVLCDIFSKTNQYNTSLEELDNYFMQFAIIARRQI